MTKTRGLFGGLVVFGLLLAALANAFSYQISITNADFTGNTLTLTGNATADYVGNINQQWVSFNWGDGTAVERVLAQDLPGFSESSGTITLTNWTHSHSYTGVGSFTVTVKIYHGNAQGNEGSQSESNTVIIQTENTLPLCSDGLDNDRDGLIDLADPDCAPFLNRAPVLNLIGPRSVDELTALSFTATASDPNGDTLTFSLIGTVPAGAAIDPATGVFSWTPTEAQGPGAYPVTVQVFDGLATDEETFAVIVNEVNIAPVANDDDINTDEDIPVAITLSASDADLPANTLAPYTIVTQPANGGLNLVSGNQYLYTSLANYTGTDFFTFKVNDGAAESNTATVSLTVNPVNDLPILATIGNQTGSEGVAIGLSVSASDFDGDTLTYDAAGLPTGASFDASSQTFSWTPDFSQSGNYQVTFSVNDGQSGTDSETVPFDIGDVNRTPALDAIGNQLVDEETALTFTANASDPDGDPLTYSASGLPTGASFDSASGAFSWTPTEAQGPGAYPLTISVSDGSLNDGEDLVITVAEVNLAPVATDDTATIDEDTTLTIPFTGLLTNDTDVDSPAQTLSITAVANAQNGTAVIVGADVQFTADADFNGAASFDYTVSDGALTDIGTVAVTVNPVDEPPTPVENDATLCADGLDNDGDQLIDLADPDCAAFVPPAPTPAPTPTPTPTPADNTNSGGSSSSGGRRRLPPAAPTVLGASVEPIGEVLGDYTCAPYLTSYIKFGARNNPADVRKLKTFLNQEMGVTLPITDIYDQQTMFVVNRFQVKYWQEVLRPWVPYGLPTPQTSTGYVYKTTSRQINNLTCPELNLPIPPLP